MKKFFNWIGNLIYTEKDHDNVIKYVEKMERGEKLSDDERKEILNSAIKLTKEQKESIKKN